MSHPSGNAANTLSPRRIGQATRSISVGIRAKLQIAFGAVALMTVVAAIVGILSFSATEREFQRVAGHDVPMMTDALRLSAMSGEISAAAARFVGARTAEEQRAIADTLSTRSRGLIDIMTRLREAQKDNISFLAVEKASQRLEQNLKALEKAILERTELRAKLEAKQTAVHKLHASITDKISPLVDDSYFEVVSAAESVGKVGNKTVRSFINGGLQRMQAALDVGAEMNIATGLLAAAALTSSPQALAMLEDRYTTSVVRAQKRLVKLAEEPEIAALRQRILTLQKLADFKSPQAAEDGASPQAGESGGVARPSDTERLNKIFRSHESFAQVLIKLVDDLNFNLATGSEDAVKISNGMLKSLAGAQISGLRDTLQTAAQTHLLTSLISEAAVAKDPARLVPIRERFTAAAEAAKKVASTLNQDEIDKAIGDLVALGAAVDGIFVLRGRELQADQVAGQTVADNAAIQRDLDKSVAELVTSAETSMKRSESELLESLGHYRTVLLAIAFVSILAAAGIGIFYIQRKLVKPLSAIDRSMNGLADQIASTISDIKVSASEVANTAAEISSATMSLSQRTEEQAASLEETTATMEVISNTVKKNADSAHQANQVAAATQNVADRGSAVVGEVVHAMARIEESSNKISDIIGVIDEIARQTNLLALNAAVEAARAGEAGRGFAVVASEVRSLAQRSAQAAKDVKDLINSSAGEVKNGVALVGRAGTSLNEIVGSIKNVADIVAGIAAATTEQATGIDQVSKALMQMDEVTQQNSALVEETAAAARSLEQQAAQMDERVTVLHQDTADDDTTVPQSETPSQTPGGETVRTVKPTVSVKPVAANFAPERKRTGTHG